MIPTYILAPMEAVNCAAFRVLCKRRGAQMIFTDMIDADTFCQYADEHSDAAAVKKYINPQDEEQPLVIQIGGRNEKNLLRLIALAQPHAYMIDLNLGCPLSSMLAKKGGVYLMKHPEQLYPLVNVLRKAITVKFSIKLRSGWDEKNAHIIAPELEKRGVDVLTIHPRTKIQRYRDRADWQYARKVKESVNIPVILSGDVTNAYMAHMALAHTKCDAVMIARAAKVNPSVFTNIDKMIEKPATRYVKTAKQVRADFDEFLQLYTELEEFKFSQLQDHTLWFLTQCTAYKHLAAQVLEAKTPDDLKKIVYAAQF